ncbi:MAG: LamG-like jellyroll fold domain-containing protein [bacterium]
MNKKLFSLALMIIIILLTSSSLSFSQGSGWAYNFKSPVSYIKIPYDLYFQVQTIEASIKIDPALKGTATLFTDGNDENNSYIDSRYLLRLVKSGDSTFYLSYQIKVDTGWLIQTSKTLLHYNKWYTITAQYDGNSVSIYLNGVNDDSKVVRNSTKNSLFNLVRHYIGYNPITKGEYFKGLMDEVRYWTIAIPIETIRYWMHIPVADYHPNYKDLACYYRCDNPVNTVDDGYTNCRDDKNGRDGYTWGIESSEYYSRSNYTRSSHPFYFNYDDYESRNVSGKSFGIFYNNKLFQFLNDAVGPYTIKGNLNDKNEVTLDNSSFYRTGHTLEFPAACCVYKDNLIYISMKHPEDQSSHLATIYHCVGTLANDGDVLANFVSRSLHICVAPALAVLKDTLYFFYITNDNNTIKLNVDWSLDGINWTFLRTLNIKSSDLDYNFGNLSACTSKDIDGNETIYLGYVNKAHTGIQLLRFYKDREEECQLLNIDKVRNFSMVSGTIDGGMTNGYELQIFFSYGNNKQIARIEYSIENSFAYRPEELPITGSDIGDGSLEYQRFIPYAFSYYKTYGTSQQALGKKIILVVQRIDSKDSKKQGVYEYLCWNSDKMTYIPEADTTDTNPDIRISQLLGVIEGPPPYVLNGENLGDLIKYKIYPSSLEFGSSTSQSQDSTISISNSWSISFRYEGLGGDFEHHATKENKTEYSTKNFENRLVFPTEGRQRGYKIFLRPIITRKKFLLTDGNNNFLDNIYTLEISDRFIDYIPYYLDTVAHAPNPSDFKSYMNRSVNPGDYHKIYSANYSWAAGAASTIGFETDSVVTRSTSEDMYKGAGLTLSLDMGLGLGVEMTTNIFSFESRIGTTAKHDGSISLGNSKNISINTDCPFHGAKGDTSHFSGTVYWIKPTAGKNNWWVPKGYESQNPWCITYKVNTFSLYPEAIEDNLGLLGGTANIYPNPASDNISIDLNNGLLAFGQNTSISIYNSLGMEIKHFGDNELSGKSSISFSAENIPPGVYYCTVYSGMNSSTKSFVVVR